MTLNDFFVRYRETNHQLYNINYFTLLLINFMI